MVERDTDRGCGVLAGLGRVVLAVVVAMVGVGWFVPGAAGQGCDPERIFEESRSYSLGDSPRDVAIADFNGDGFPDLAVASINTDEVIVSLNLGDGRFFGAYEYMVGDGPSSVETADFNGDGFMDIASANIRGGVSVLLGQGDGTFEAARHSPVSFSPAGLAAADFNHDGQIDLAVALDASSVFTISVLTGNGDGTFDPEIRYRGGWGTLDVASGDLDSDGNIDLVTANELTQDVAVLMGNGDGAFERLLRTLYCRNCRYRWIVTEDLDNDGILDIAAARSSPFRDHGVKLGLGNGDGTFRSSGFLGTEAWAGPVVASDVTSDGILDILVADIPGVSLFVGQGDGMFAPRVVVAQADGDHPRAIAVADFDGNGSQDLVTVHAQTDEVVVWLSRCGEPLNSIEILDPRDAPFRADDWLTDPASDPAALIDGGREVVGFAADGVTPILVRLELPGPGELTLTLPADGSGGFFRGFDRSVLGTSVQPVVYSVFGWHFAFAVVTAPEDFVAEPSHEQLGEREAPLRITWRADGAPEPIELTRPIVVKRPPVTLLHGNWSSYQGAWAGKPIEQELLGLDVDLVHANYPAAEPFAANVPNVLGSIEGVLELYRRGRDGTTPMAVTRTDVVAHSMGGVLTRLLIADWGDDPYLDPEANYSEGYVNRLITLDSPHCGATTATHLVEADGVATWWGLMLERVFGECVDCGSVRDLRPDGVQAPSTIGVGVPVHAIVGTGGSDAIGVLQTLRCLQNPLGCAMWKMFWLVGAGAGWEDVLFGAGSHDLIVSEPSQSGGLLAPRVTDFGFGGVFEPGHHLSITGEERVADRVIELLNSSVRDDAWADGFPAGCPDGPPPPPLPPLYEGPGGLEVISPAEGFEVMAGETIEVDVAAWGEFELIDGVVQATFDAAPLEGGMTVMLEIPESATGTLTVGALGFNAAGEVALAETIRGRIIIPADLVGLEIAQRPVILTEHATDVPVQLLGQYSDGIQREVPIGDDVSWTIEDASVATVSPEGVVSGISTGDTRLTVTVPGSGEAFSDSVAVLVNGIEPCRPDLDGDGELTIFDFLAFQNAFDAGDLQADFDGDGELTIFDFLAFQTAFDAGCG